MSLDEKKQLNLRYVTAKKINFGFKFKLMAEDRGEGPIIHKFAHNNELHPSQIFPEKRNFYRTVSMFHQDTSFEVKKEMFTKFSNSLSQKKKCLIWLLSYNA